MTSTSVRDRSIKFPTQRYQDLARSMDYDQAVYLANYCRSIARGEPRPWGGVAPVDNSMAHNREQYLAYAAYWQSIADARAARIRQAS